MSKKLLKVMDYLINEQEDKARDLLHQLFIEKARAIHEEMRHREEEDEETLGGDEGLGLGDEITHNREEIDSEEHYGDGTMEDVDVDLNDAVTDLGDDLEDVEDDTLDIVDDVEDDDDDDMEDEPSMDSDLDMDTHDEDESDVHDLEQAIDDLRAEFEALKAEVEGGEGSTDDEFGSEDDDDEFGSEDTDDEFGSEDDDGEFGSKEDDDLDMSDHDIEDMDHEPVEVDEEWDDEMDEWDDLDEAIDLDIVSIDAKRPKEVGSGKFSRAEANTRSPVPSSQRDKFGAKPVVTGKGPRHSGYDRQTAPVPSEMKVADKKAGDNRRKKSTDGTSQISKEGDTSALINKDHSDGFGATNKRSPLGSGTTPSK